jgi:hypothetical protein
MTSDLAYQLARALMEDRLRTARERQAAASLRGDDDGSQGCASYARRRRWMRRLRLVLFPGRSGGAARYA